MTHADDGTVLSLYTSPHGNDFVLISTPIMLLSVAHTSILRDAARARRRYRPDTTNPMVTVPLGELREHGLMAGDTITDRGREALRILERAR